jgi:hypothetical protein
LFQLDGMHYAGVDNAHCGVRRVHCAIRGISQQWPLMLSHTRCVLPVRPGMGKWRLMWRRGSVHVRRACHVRWWALPGADFYAKTWPSRRQRLIVQTGSHGQGGNLSCEWVVMAEVGERRVVLRTTKYYKMMYPYRMGCQVLGGGGILSYGLSSTKTADRTPLFADCRVVSPSPGPCHMS